MSCHGPYQLEMEQVGVGAQAAAMGHGLGTASPSTVPAGGWLLCTSAALPAYACVPLYVCVPLCTRVPACAHVCVCICVHATASVHHVCCVPLCIPVHACAHVHLPRARMCPQLSPPAALVVSPPRPGVGLGTGDGSQWRQQLPADSFQMWLLEAQLRTASSPRAPWLFGLWLPELLEQTKQPPARLLHCSWAVYGALLAAVQLRSGSSPRLSLLRCVRILGLFLTKPLVPAGMG